MKECLCPVAWGCKLISKQTAQLISIKNLQEQLTLHPTAALQQGKSLIVVFLHRRVKNAMLSHEVETLCRSCNVMKRMEKIDCCTAFIILIYSDTESVH
eukprot:6294838-Ditylum_brightwellii.AAC.1